MVTTAPQPQTAPHIRPFPLPDGVVGKPYRAFLRAGGAPPILWSGVGLPEGMWVGELGAVLGTPMHPGVYTVLVSAQNFSGKKTREIRLRVRDRHEIPPRITTCSLPPARVGCNYMALLEATAPVYWHSHDLPRGLSLDRRFGMIVGVPRTDGFHTVHITARNNWGEHTITVPLEVA